MVDAPFKYCFLNYCSTAGGVLHVKQFTSMDADKTKDFKDEEIFIVIELHHFYTFMQRSKLVKLIILQVKKVVF